MDNFTYCNPTEVIFDAGSIADLMLGLSEGTLRRAVQQDPALREFYA